MPEDRGAPSPLPGVGLQQAAWPDMFANLQSAYAELTRAQFELEQRAGEVDHARDLFQRVVESMSEGLFLLDRMGHIVQTNRAASLLTGRSERDLLGEPFADLFADEMPSTSWALLERTPDGTVKDLDAELRLSGGATLPVNVSCTIVRDARGKITGVLAVARDITERRRAEEALRFIADASRTLARSLDLDTMLASLARTAVPTLGDWCSIGVFEEDSVRHVAGAHIHRSKEPLIHELYRPHAAVSDCWGCGQEMRSGEMHAVARVTEVDLLALAPDERDRALLRDLGVTSHLSVPMRTPSGASGFIALNFGDSGRRYGPAEIALAEDLAGRAALAVDNARMYQQAAVANRMKDEFLATLSHELRTPLGPILGWTRMLLGGQLRPSARTKALESIDRNARTQLTIVEDILDVARALTGKLRVDLAAIDFADVICDAVESITPTANTKSIQIVANVSEAIPVMGDAARLQQVAWNLLSNAIKFTPPGGHVEIGLRVDGAAAELTVTDSGIGITAAFLPFVFDKFRQADGSFTRRHGGLGLGLAIVRQLVELHGGSVRADSEGEGRGAAFTVRLPIDRESVSPSDAARSVPVTPGRLSGVSVLIVDDDADARDLVQLWLEAEGATAIAAVSAVEAHAVLQTRTPTVLVVDIAMPAIDGYAFIRGVRAGSSPQRDVPALAYSAHAQDDDRVRALAAGFQAHVTKPADPAAIVDAVAALAADAAPRPGPGPATES